MSVLILAENPSVGRALSSVVGANKTSKGCIEGGGYIVSWCVGHLVGLKNPNEYGCGWEQKWSFSQLPMIPDSWQFKVTESTKEQFGIVKALMGRDDVTEIICATDADREGECIFRYVYNMARCRKPVKRLWVSSLEESAIRQALVNMKPMSDYDNLFYAGFSRAKADWLVGMNGSRLFSCRYGGKLNIGRVQTPTLSMLVKREYDVKHFVKQKYFTADIACDGFTLSSARINDETAVIDLISSCAGKPITVTAVKKEVKTVNAPKLYDLTTLQREANKTHGYTAQQTLDYTQNLYEKKLITYPRTDSQFLSDDMEQTALDVLKLCNTYLGFNMVHTPDLRKVINNKKVAGHHAIIPTSGIATADLNGLPSGEKNILVLVARKLICASAPAHKYESVKVTAECGGTEFAASGKTVLDMGWKRYAVKSADDKEDDKSLPVLTEGQVLTGSLSKGEHFTSPPKPYTEDTLLSAMEHAGQDEYDEDSEKKGLGTPATRAAVIESLVKNGYAERKGKQIIPTDRGIDLVSVVPDEVKSARLTAEWEMKLQQVEHGQYSADSFMSEIEQNVRDMCGKYGKSDNSVSFSDGKFESAGRCPKCGAEVINGKFGWYCKGKCGMNVAKVFGVALSDAQVKGLLNGKSTSYMKNGRKTIVLPEVVPNEYQGKTYYNWKTEGKKK
ncbi:DNA topoisomerase 3 [Ruminococcus flavefaciens]|uniref:DNA topoisomerase 3 n=1 Tax=Ruminococcus flavefaciens TaxID=1265 RepID=UPI0026ECA26A|nr:DNA topoisomerase 3 [Ruminococcus flavefaciens]MDD7517481.1 DNA topoisomerase 3 [Ruminococcus flavefaciens]MDY5692329.1 DNA topoisomerase 3 [Ruminococcus flavefaciens]